MNKPIPWNINGVGFDAREAAREAARRQGKSLGEWLHGVIADHAATEGLDSRDIGGQGRIDAVTAKLERLSARRGNAARDDEAQSADLAQWRDDGARDEAPRGRRGRSLPAIDADALLEDAVDAMDRRARRAERHTDEALRSFARMLERNEAQRERERESVTTLAEKLTTIETQLSDRFEDRQDNPIKGALARLEARLDAIGRRSAAETAALRSAAANQPQPDRIGKLEDKLNAILQAVHARPTPASEASPVAIAAAGAAGSLKNRRLGEAIADIAKRQRMLDPERAPRGLAGFAVPRRPSIASEAAPFAAMQGELAALASTIETLRHDVMSQRGARPRADAAVDGLRDEVAAMTRTLRELTPRADTTGIEDSLRALGDRIGSSRGRGLRDSVLRPVERAAGDVQRSLDALDPRGAIDGLQHGLRSIDDKLGALDARSLAAGGVDDVHAQMREIRDLIVATAAKPLAVERIERQIAALGDRLDQQMAHPVAASELDAAADRLQALVANPRGAAFDKIESRLDALAAKIDGMATTPEPRPSDRDAPAEALESLVRDLREKLDAANGPTAGDSALEALQDQIGRLAARFEATDSGLAKLGALERSMRELFAHLDETRASVETSAARAARDVLRVAVEDGRTVNEHGAVTHLTAMKALQDEAEARTSSTLAAVHETFEKVVDRLSLMETDLADVRRRPAAPVAPGPGPSAAPAPATGRPKTRDIPSEMALGAPDPLADQLLGDRIGGKASPEPARGRPVDLDDEKSRADFIAAARRAAKTAQSETALDELQRSVAAGARSGAKAAGMAATAAHADRAVRAGLIEQSRDYVARHKRPVLLSLAALFVIVGTMAVVQRLGLGAGGGDAQIADAAPPARVAQMSVATRPPARSEADNDALTPSALPKATPAIPASIPGSDPVQTGSITALPSFATGSPAAPPRPTLPAGLTTMAQNGDGDAEYVLGTQYAEGRLLPRDFSAAARWYQKAADQGLAPAQYRLAALYEKGLGVGQDKIKARALYLEAAEAGNPRAMHNLAVLLADGDGKPDYAGAATWFRKAAQFGIHDSQYNLAILLARGLGVPQSMVQSYQWFAIAATQNDADAAKKRDEVAGRLSASDLAVAKALATAFKPRIADVAAIGVQPPPGGWDGAATPNNLNSARHKISSL